jgi:hypothetical protein
MSRAVQSVCMKALAEVLAALAAPQFATATGAP